MRSLLRLSGLWLGIALAIAVPVQGQNWRTMTSARQLQDRDPIRAEIQYGAGDLTISPAEAGYLYRMELRYDEEGVRPLAEYDADEHELRLGTSGEINRRGVKSANASTARIQLSREVPIDLEVRFGAGKADIELGGISLQHVDIGTGASETTVRFGSPNPIQADEILIEAGAAELSVVGLGNARASRIAFQGGVGATTLDFSGAGGDMEVEIEMGVGSLVLRLPRSHGVRMERDSFLTSFTAPGMTRDGDSYVTSNWASSTRKIEVDIEAALGSIEIEWID